MEENVSNFFLKKQERIIIYYSQLNKTWKNHARFEVSCHKRAAKYSH